MIKYLPNWIVLGLFFLCLLRIEGYAQNYVSRALSLKDGLSSQYVWDISQDEDGVMWFLTLEGLDLYDGQGWTHYDSLPGVPSFPIQKWSQIHKLDDGVTWLIGADFSDKVVAVKYDGNKWEHYTTTLASHMQPVFSDVEKTQNGYKLLISTKFQFAYSEDSGDSWFVDRLSDDAGNILNAQFYDDEPYIFSQGGVYKKFGTNWLKRRFSFENSPHYQDLTPIVSIEKHPDGTEVFLGSKALMKAIGSKLYPQKVLESSYQNIYGHNQIIFNKNGQIATSLNSKLYIEYVGGAFNLVQSNISDQDSFINRFYIDRQGIIWVATNRGIIIFPNLGFYSFNVNSGLIENEVSSIEFFDNGNTFLGSNVGWQIIKNGQFIVSKFFEESRSKPVRMQQSVIEGNSVIASASNLGLLRVQSNGSYKVLFEGMVHTVTKFNGEIYFLNRNQELYKLNQKDEVELVRTESNHLNMYVRKIIASNDGKLLAIGMKGVADMLTDEMIYSVKEQSLIKREMDTFDIQEMVDDEPYWLIATMSGLMKFYPDSGELERYFMGIDFPVYVIEQIGQNHLMVGSDRGLYEIDIDNQKVTNYSVYDGLLGNEVNRDALKKGPTGKIWVGTAAGLSVMHPQMMNKDVRPPLITINQIEDLKKNKVLDTQSLSMESVDANTTLSVDLSIAGFYAPELLEIRYRLNRSDEWIYEQNLFNRTKIFHSLSPGNYQLQVQAKEINTDWSELVSSPVIVVQKPIYQTIWFYLFIMLVVAGLSIILYRIRYYRELESRLHVELDKRTSKLRDSQIRLEQQNRELTEVNKSLDQFTSAVSHDLKSPLNSSIGLLDLMDETYSKEELLHFTGMINSNLKKMKAFIHELIEISRNANQGLHYEVIDFRALITEIYELHNQTPEEKRIDKRLDVRDDVEFLGDLNRLRVIFSNLISNSIKYYRPESGIPFCDIHVDILEKEAIIIVKDNGLGIPKKHLNQVFDMFYRAETSVSGSGLGLFLVNEIIEKMNGTIRVNSEEGMGTTFYLTIPNGLNRPTKTLPKAKSEPDSFISGAVTGISSANISSKK